MKSQFFIRMGDDAGQGVLENVTWLTKNEQGIIDSEVCTGTLTDVAAQIKKTDVMDERV